MTKNSPYQNFSIRLIEQKGIDEESFYKHIESITYTVEIVLNGRRLNTLDDIASIHLKKFRINDNSIMIDQSAPADVSKRERSILIKSADYTLMEDRGNLLKMILLLSLKMKYDSCSGKKPDECGFVLRSEKESFVKRLKKKRARIKWTQKIIVKSLRYLRKKYESNSKKHRDFIHAFFKNIDEVETNFLWFIGGKGDEYDRLWLLNVSSQNIKITGDKGDHIFSDKEILSLLRKFFANNKKKEENERFCKEEFFNQDDVVKYSARIKVKKNRVKLPEESSENVENEASVQVEILKRTKGIEDAIQKMSPEQTTRETLKLYLYPPSADLRENEPKLFRTDGLLEIDFNPETGSAVKPKIVSLIVNDLELRNNVLISGTSCTGKSTLLRWIGHEFIQKGRTVFLISFKHGVLLDNSFLAGLNENDIVLIDDLHFAKLHTPSNMDVIKALFSHKICPVVVTTRESDDIVPIGLLPDMLNIKYEMTEDSAVALTRDILSRFCLMRNLNVKQVENELGIFFAKLGGGFHTSSLLILNLGLEILRQKKDLSLPSLLSLIEEYILSFGCGSDIPPEILKSLLLLLAVFGRYEVIVPRKYLKEKLELSNDDFNILRRKQDIYSVNKLVMLPYHLFLCELVVEYFAKNNFEKTIFIDKEEKLNTDNFFVQILSEFVDKYPDAANHILWNMSDSKDSRMTKNTQRLLSLIATKPDLWQKSINWTISNKLKGLCELFFRMALQQSHLASDIFSPKTKKVVLNFIKNMDMSSFFDRISAFSDAYYYFCRGGIPLIYLGADLNEEQKKLIIESLPEVEVDEFFGTLILLNFSIQNRSENLINFISQVPMDLIADRIKRHFSLFSVHFLILMLGFDKNNEAAKKFLDLLTPSYMALVYLKTPSPKPDARIIPLESILAFYPEHAQQAASEILFMQPESKDILKKVFAKKNMDMPLPKEPPSWLYEKMKLNQQILIDTTYRLGK